MLDSAFNPAGGTLSVAAVTPGAHGAVAVNADGTVTYTPAAGYAGPDSFQYTVTDGAGHTATGTVSVTVGPPPADPAAAIDADLAAIKTDLNNFDPNAPAPDQAAAAIQTAYDGVQGAIDAYLNNTTAFIGTIPESGSSVADTKPLADAYASLVSQVRSMEAMRTALFVAINANAILLHSERTLLAQAILAPAPVGAIIITTKATVKELTLLQAAMAAKYIDLWKEENTAWSAAWELGSLLRTAGVPESDIPALPAEPTLPDIPFVVPK